MIDHSASTAFIQILLNVENQNIFETFVYIGIDNITLSNMEALMVGNVEKYKILAKNKQSLKTISPHTAYNPPVGYY